MGLPDLILSGIKSVFVPDEETIQSSFDMVSNKCNRLLISYDLSRLFGSELEITDVKVTMYGKEAVIVDGDVIQDGVAYFRPYIRGFLVLMLIFFSVNQFFSLIGANPVFAQGVPALPDSGHFSLPDKKGGIR